MSRNPGAKILRENEAVTKAAMAYGAEKDIETTQTVMVQGWAQEIPEVNGVFNALVAMQKEEHGRAQALLAELEETTDGRRRGEIRRHYNTISSNLERNREVINALMDKRIGTAVKAKKASKPEEETVEEETPKPTRAKKRVSPTEVKARASKRSNGGGRSRRATLENLSFKELQQWAKKRGYSAAGSREEIINRLLNNGE